MAMNITAWALLGISLLAVGLCWWIQRPGDGDSDDDNIGNEN